MLRALVELGANVHSAKNNGCTPVLIAAENGHVHIVRALADLGGDVSIADNNGKTPVYQAAGHGRTDVLIALAELGANINTPSSSGCTPLCIAAQEGNVVVVRALSKLGANVNSPRKDGGTAVYFASRQGNATMVKALVEIGADVNTTIGGWSHVYNAFRKGHLDVVLYLVSVGADVTQFFNIELNPATPLHGMMAWFCAELQVTAANTDVYVLFAMTKLLSSMMHKDKINNEDTDADRDREVFELAIARGFGQSLATSAVPKTREVSYPLKRKLCRLAYRVYLETLLFDGERISLSAKARRYVELVCFFLDQAMLTDVCALRMTCKSNHLIRRFPVLSYCYELEANLIEGCVGYDACRFVSTSQMHQIINIHSRA
jgi:ankyrin repeat protein